LDTICLETGKTRTEALYELFGAINILTFYRKHAKSFLKDESRTPHGPMRFLKRVFIRYFPRGVVGVISPWNYPFLLRLCRDLPNQIEEERRLFYVGVTRAKERLFLSLCRYRFGPMGKEPREPSPFLEDIPRELMERAPSPNEGWLSSLVGSSQFSRQTYRG